MKHAIDILNLEFEAMALTDEPPSPSAKRLCRKRLKEIRTAIIILEAATRRHARNKKLRKEASADRSS